MIDDQIQADYERAHNKALVNDLRAAIARRDNRLMSFHDFRSRINPEGESYRGMQEVPITRIVGSMDRYQDFDRTFLPKKKHTRSRWKNIDKAYYQDVRLPPIQLYKVGDVYFVKDGNHRVSVARERGVEFIDAEVIEGHVRVPITSEMSTEELLMQAEYAEFLRRTDLDRLQPDHDIRPTSLGRYDEIWQHIELHRQWLSWIWHRQATVHEAVNDWYEYIYMPIIQVVRDREVLREFPRHTEADIYLWVMKNRHMLEDEQGQDVGPIASAEAYADLMTQPLSFGDRVRAAIAGPDTRRSPDPAEERERRRHRLRRWARPRAR